MAKRFQEHVIIFFQTQTRSFRSKEEEEEYCKDHAFHENITVVEMDRIGNKWSQE